MSTVLSATSLRFLELAASGRPRPAIDEARALTVQGMPFDHLLVEVLAPVLREVGRLWQFNQWSAAQEHAATSVIDGVVGAIGLQTPPPRDETRGTVLVACVEGEYHSAAARMGVELLRYDGWDVTFLGASVPAQDLRSFVAQTTPEVVVLSCTFALNLGGASRCVAALADLDVPTIVAGAAFGATDARAVRLGASAWIGGEMSPTAVLRATHSAARPALAVDPESARLELCSAELVEACMAEMFLVLPLMSARSERQLDQARTGLSYILGFLRLTIDLDEVAVFDDFIAWLAALLAARDVPAMVVPLSLQIVADAARRAGRERVAATCLSSRDRLQHTATSAT